MGSYFCFATVLRLITPYASIMKIASNGNPNGYSGIGGAAGIIMKFLQGEREDSPTTGTSELYSPAGIGQMVSPGVVDSMVIMAFPAKKPESM
jgi:hypothetical protein